MQVAIHGALQLHRANHEVGSIEVVVPVFKYCNRPFPKDTDEARFSFQYNVAVALIDGAINDGSYSEAKLHSAEVQDYLGRMKLVYDPTIPRDFGEMQVVVRLASGETVESDAWPGHWKTPMTQDEKAGKFANCCAAFWNTETAGHYHGLIADIAEPGNLELILEGLTKG